MAGLYDNTGYVPSWARANMEAAGLQPDTGTMPVAPAPVVTDYSNTESQIARGVRSAFTGAKAALQGFGGMGAELVGADDYARQLYDYALQNQQLAEKQGPRVRTVRQVLESENPLSAGVDYLAGTVGQVTPYMLLGGVGGLVGRGVGLASGLRAGLSGEALAARAATGAGWGGTAAIHPVMAGDQAVQLQQDPAAAGMSVGERTLRANAVGALQAGANALAPAAMVNQAFTRGAQQALAPRILGNMALEGIGEGAEEVVNQAHRTTYDPNFKMDPELIGENAAAGFFGAAPVAGLHGAATHTAHGAADAVVDGAKALGAGAQWVGAEAYKNMPPQARQALDYLAKGGEATQEVLDTLAPYGNALVATGKISADAFMRRANAINEDDSTTAKAVKLYTGTMEGAAKAWAGLTRVAESAAGHVGRAIEGATEEGKKALAEVDSPDIPDTVKAHVAQAEDTGDRLLRTAEAFDDLSKWVGENEEMTPALLRAIDGAAQQPQRLRQYANEIVRFIDGSGQDTPAANELREYTERMARGENLSADEVRNFWLKSRLAAEVERTSENLDALLNAKGVKMTKQNGTVTVENLSRQSTVFNRAIKAALGDATTDKKLINAIANSIQVQDVVGDAQKTVREKVTKALATFGINPKADNTFTRMYDAVLSAVNEQVSALKEEGVIPALEGADVPDAFRADVRAIFTELLQTTDAGREMASSEALVAKHATALADYLAQLASGELGEGAAVKLRHALERTFGKEKEGVVDQTVDRLMKAASAAFSGVDNDTAERVHALANLNQTLAQKEAQIRRLIKFDVGEGRNLRGQIDDLLKEIELAYEFDAKRAELPTALAELQGRLRQLPPKSNEAYRLRARLGELRAAGLLGVKKDKDSGALRYVVEDGTTGFTALKRTWVKTGVVTAQKFEALVEALESYSGNPERLTRPEKRVVSHDTPANHTAEDENDVEALQDRALADDDDGEDSVSNFDLDGKRTGDERQEYLEKRRREKYGQDVTESAAAQPIYWGANAFEKGGHDARKVSAPVSRYTSDDRQKASGAPNAEYNDMVDAAYAKYGHRVTDGHPVSVQRWAAEMADATGKSERQLLDEAMAALLEHDQKRLENPKTSTEDAKWIEARADLADRVGGNGAQFFQHKINRHYGYYKMKPADGTNLSYSRDYLERTAALRTRNGYTDDAGAFVTRMQERDQHKFTDEIYENSLLELTTTDGTTITVDVPKLVRDAMVRHQAAEAEGLGEKNVEPDLGKEIVTAFHNVMAALMTTDGIAEVGGLFESDDPTGGSLHGKRRPTGDFNTHVDPNLIIFRDPKGVVLQRGEHVLAHSVKRAYTLGDLTKITGIDPRTLRVRRKERGGLADADIASIVQPERRSEKPGSKAALGVAVGGATLDGKRISIDYHQLLARMLERNGIDPHQALRQGTLPHKLAAVLLREGLADLRARGVEGDAVTPGAVKFDTVVVYHRPYDDASYPVELKQLRKYMTNEKVDAPRNLRDAKIQEAMDALRENEAAERAVRKRVAEVEADAMDKDTEQMRRLEEATAGSIEKTNFLIGIPDNQDESGAKLRMKRDEDSLALEPTRGKGDGPKFSQDEGENMRIQQILKELGADSPGDTPLFDKTEAFGKLGGKEWVRQKRDEDEDAGGVQRPEVPDHVEALREALMKVAAKDPMTKKFLEETFDMPFLDGDKMSKPFSDYMETRTAKLNALARTRNDLGSVQRELPEKTKPLSLAEQRANAKMTTETLATNAQGKRQAANAIRAEEIAKAKDALEVERIAEARRLADEREAEALEAESEVKVEPVAEPEVNLNAAGTRPEAARALNKMGDENLKQALLTLPIEPQAGTLAAHLRKELTKPSPVMKEWAEETLKRAGITADDIGSRLVDQPFSRQRTVETPRASAPGLEALTAEVERLLGEGKVALEMPFEVKDTSGKGISGKYDDKLKKILVSAVAADRMGTAWHETWHRVEDLLGTMGEHGKRVLDEVHKYTSTPMMQNWLRAHYSGDEGVASQLDTASERAAFAFQMFMHGAKMPIADKTPFQKVKDWIRRMLGKLGLETTTNEERGQSFFQYVKDGGFARDVENAPAIRQGLNEKKGDSLIHAAVDTLKPVMEGIEKVLEHSSTRVQKLGIPEYNEILVALIGRSGKGGIQLDRSRFKHKFSNALGNVLGGKTPEEQQAILNNGGVTPVLDQITKYMADAGVDARTRQNMRDRVEAFNADLINDHFEAFVTDLVQHGGFKGRAGDARKIASGIVDKGYFYDPDIKLFEQRPDLAKKWMERDLMEKLLRYVERATHLAEYTRRFGQVKEYETPEGTKYKQAEKLHDLLAAGDEKATPEGRKLIRDFMDAQNGQYGGRLSPEMKKLYGGLMFAQNVNILPMAVFSQMLEPMQLALRKNSMRGSLDSLFRGIRDLPKTFDAVNKRVAPDYWEKLMHDVGAAPSRIIRGTMQELMNGIHMGGTVGELNDQFFKHTMQTQWNRSMHVEGVRHAVEFLREHKANVENRAGDTDKDGRLRSERLLDELELTARDIKFNAAGELELNDKTERAIVQFVEEALAHPDPGSNPMWMNDPRWALVAQMKRFTFGHTRFILDRGIKELKLGNAFPLAPAIIAMPWMMAADGLRDALSGSEGYQSKGALDYAKHAMERASLFGRGQFGLDALNAAGRGGSPVEALGGPTLEMAGNIARGAHNGHLIDTLLEYTPGGDFIQATM